MWRPRPSPRQNGTCAETEEMNARPRGRNFSVAARRQEQGTDGGSPRHPNVRRAPKSAWSPAPTLREELRAMVAPEKSNRSCAVRVHQRRKVCATQAAALAATFTRSRNNAEERDHDHHRKDHLEVEGGDRDATQEPRARVDAYSSETLRRLRDAPQEALFRAVEKGDITGFRRTLRSSNVWIDARGPQDETPLLVAARLGHLDCVRQCLARGAFVDARNASGESALHLASYAGHAEVVELLLGAAATVQPSTEFGETALFYAARKGYVHIARALILHGDDPYHTDRFGDTALAQSRDAATRSVMEAAHRGFKSSTGEPICLLQRAPLAVLARIMSFLDEDDFRAAGAASAAWAVAARHASARPRPMAILRRSASRPQSSPMLSSSALVASESRGTRQARGPSISSARQARERSRIFLPDNLDVLF